MRYNDVYTFLKARLEAKGYGQQGGPELPLFDPGPFTIDRLKNLSPGPMLFVVFGNGVGLRKEALFDVPFITIRVIGSQGDFDYAEKLAYDVDDILLSVASNTDIGSGKALFITRTGGAPQLVDFDSAERYSFQTTYITEVQRG